MDSSRLRSRPAVLLLAASLLTSLALGGLLVAAHRLYDRAPAAAAGLPLSDDQSRQQVVDPARDFVRLGKMRAPTASYLLVSCSAEEEPPYQGTMYLNFDVPSITETTVYFREIAQAMTARGWHEGIAPGHHPDGHTLAKDGLVAMYYRHPDLPGRAVLQIYGECRNVTDHRLDDTGFVDVTGQMLPN